MCRCCLNIKSRSGLAIQHFYLLKAVLIYRSSTPVWPNLTALGWVSGIGQPLRFEKVPAYSIPKQKREIIAAAAEQGWERSHKCATKICKIPYHDG